MNCIGLVQVQAAAGAAGRVGKQSNSFVGGGRTTQKTTRLVVKAVAGELSSDSTTYLVAGAALVALVGTAFPILFSRKDTCPECDGAGFVRKAAGVLKANAARKDLPQIVCTNCNGLGKLGQIDK